MDYIHQRKREMETTLNVLRAYPESKIDLRPAEKSRTAAGLAMILAVEERVLKPLMETGSTDFNLLNYEVPSSMAEIISVWQQAVDANDAALAAMSSRDLERPATFYGMHISLGDALWYELFDHIHHRGQLSVYMRLAGAKLPSIYGPIADEPFCSVHDRRVSFRPNDRGLQDASQTLPAVINRCARFCLLSRWWPSAVPPSLRRSSMKEEKRMDQTSINREFVKHHFEAVNRREVQTLLGNMRPDLYDHELDGDHKNDLREGAERLQVLMKQVPDLTVEVRDIIANGDKVVVRAVWSGREAVSQRKVEFHGFVQWRIVDGKFAERWATVTPIVEIPEGAKVW